MYDCRFVHVDCFTACNRAVAAAAAAAAAKQSKEIFCVFIHTHNYWGFFAIVMLTWAKIPKMGSGY